MCQQGQDYLVATQGDPTAIQATAIPLENIFRSLRQVAATKVLVLLDVNRNESSFSHETVGRHTVHLASITGIPTILSCQPDEFSRETSALGHGFFTAALLSGLRSRQCPTVGTLGAYLSQQLPALSEHYWRPIQQPVTICPSEKLQQPILPLVAAALPSVDDRSVSHAAIAHQTALPAGLRSPSSAGNPDSFYGAYTNGNGHSTGVPTAVAGSTERTSAKPSPSADRGAIQTPYKNPVVQNSSPASGGSGGFNGSTNGSTSVASGSINGFTNGSTPASRQNGQGAHTSIDSATQNHENRVAQSTQATTVSQPHSDQFEDVNDGSDALFWRPVLRWGSFVVVGLILGVLLRNCAAFTPKTPSAHQAAKSGTEQGGTRQSGTGQPGTGQSGATPVPTSGASPKAKTPDATAIVPISAPGTPTDKALSPQPIANTQPFGAAGAGQLNAAAVAVAKPQPIQPPAPSHLAKARALVAVNSDQASPYWYAIQEARSVKPGQPDYQEAQQDIALWSRRIMAIAQQRGKQGLYDAAIVAVRRVPQDQPDYAKVKGSLTQWCPGLDRQRGANPAQVRQARTICRSPV